MISLRSKLRCDLLVYYFTNPTASHYLRELAELLSADPANLSRELAALARQGLFVWETRGRQKHFRLNRKHPLFHEYRRIIFKTVGMVGQLRNTLSHTSGIQEAYLYGSFARHEADALSDIDLLLVGDVMVEELEPTIGKLERQLGREINYTLMDSKEFKSRRARKDPFLADVWKHKRIRVVPLHEQA